jgi:hypothetical protein
MHFTPNMDLPWNPAVLEQRIARITAWARNGRFKSSISSPKAPSRRVCVLALKRSLSADILDGTSGEISLGGSRLTLFLKDVEKRHLHG